MKLGEAIIKSKKFRDLWIMDVHVLNELEEGSEEFDENYICVIDINLYIYVKHDYCKNHKIYYTAQNYQSLTNDKYI